MTGDWLGIISSRVHKGRFSIQLPEGTGVKSLQYIDTGTAKKIKASRSVSPVCCFDTRGLLGDSQ